MYQSNVNQISSFSNLQNQQQRMMHQQQQQHHQHHQLQSNQNVSLLESTDNSPANPNTATVAALLNPYQSNSYYNSQNSSNPYHNHAALRSQLFYGGNSSNNQSPNPQNTQNVSNFLNSLNQNQNNQIIQQQQQHSNTLMSSQSLHSPVNIYGSQMMATSHLLSGQFNEIPAINQILNSNQTWQATNG